VTRGPVRTVFFGSGWFALPILEALLASPEVEIVGVVSAPDRPVGRRHEPTPTPLAARAAAGGLTLLRPPRIRDEATIAELASLRPALGVLADYGRIVPQAVLDLPRHGILNVHPSLLPRHRGATPIPAAILAGDDRTGVTVIRMDAGLDTGPVVASEGWPLDGTETAPELELRAAASGAQLLARTLPTWLDGMLEEVPQDEDLATLTRPLHREDGRLDPDLSAASLARQVRAYQPWPGSYLETGGGRLTIWRAAPAPSDRDDEPGRLVDADGRPALTTIAGRLVLEEVQPAGGRRMTGDAFVRGRGLVPLVPLAPLVPPGP
jgi:methionyl-tRNA formyltransferase